MAKSKTIKSKASSKSFRTGLLVTLAVFGAIGAYVLATSQASGQLFITVRGTGWYDSTKSKNVTVRSVNISSGGLLDNVKVLEVKANGKLHMGAQGGTNQTPNMSCFVLRAPDSAATVRLYSYGRHVEVQLSRSENLQERCYPKGSTANPGYHLKHISGGKVQVLERRDYFAVTGSNY